VNAVGEGALAIEERDAQSPRCEEASGVKTGETRAEDEDVVHGFRL
jgi:hypothetical protein